MSGKTVWIKKLILVLVSILVSCLLLEVGVLLVLGEVPKFPRRVVGSSYGLRMNEPNAVYRHKSADMTTWFRINSQGLRADQDYSYEKPPGVTRILVLGDSFTIGYEVDNDQTFASVLERELQREGYSVQVLNAGVSGFSTAEQYVYLKREGHRFSPDIVVVAFFTNDLPGNVNSDLFRLVDGVLEEGNPTYVPGGALADFLNTNWFFNVLCGYSNAFAVVKERTTGLFKRKVVTRNVETVDDFDKVIAMKSEAAKYQHRLGIAIFEDLYRFTSPRGMKLLYLEVPPLRRDPLRMVEVFPAKELDFSPDDVDFISGKQLLDPHLDREQLYHTRSHGHWTPLSHKLAGQALAERIIERGWLGERAGLGQSSLAGR